MAQRLHSFACGTCLALLALLPTGVSAASPGVLDLELDARDAPRRLLHSRVTFAAAPGELTLAYPRYGIATYRAPDTIVNDIVGLRFVALGRPLEWQRDPLDSFTFHVKVPAGATEVVASLDVVPAPGRTDFDAATGQLLILDWPTVLLYPPGSAAAGLQVDARLRLPEGWRADTTLDTHATADGSLVYERTSLGALMDSPVLAGKYFASALIREAAPAVLVSVASDTPNAAAIPPAWRTRLERVVAEAEALFGGFPYRRFHFHLALGDQLGNDGLEHRQSNDLRLALAGLTGEDNRRAYGYLLPHEYVHAWNGKYRVPRGVLRADFQAPQTTELLWVYEGLTRYLNWVLAARSGILSFEESLDYGAFLSARLMHRPGRAWRSLEDTALSTAPLLEAPDAWESMRRGVDYYDEGLLLWLAVDAQLRRSTNGRRSLDDFCRQFFGASHPPDEVAPYDFEDVVAALAAIAPFDWRSFLRARLDLNGNDQLLSEALSASGWELDLRPAPNVVQRAREAMNHVVDERVSIGLLAGAEGGIADVVHGSSAWDAGLGPLMTIERVDGQPWSAEGLRRSLSSGAPRGLDLEVANGAEHLHLTIPGPLTLRAPLLRRNRRPDLLTDILRPRASTAKH